MACASTKIILIKPSDLKSKIHPHLLDCNKRASSSFQSGKLEERSTSTSNLNLHFNLEPQPSSVLMSLLSHHITVKSQFVPGLATQLLASGPTRVQKTLQLQRQPQPQPPPSPSFSLWSAATTQTLLQCISMSTLCCNEGGCCSIVRSHIRICS